MPDVIHRQFDELPVQDFVLSYDVAANLWPALNATDKVTMVVNKSGTATTVTLTKVDLTGRVVRWSPTAPLNATAGTFPFVVRVTQQDNQSYTHPKTGTWNLIITPAAVTTDVTDPA